MRTDPNEELEEDILLEELNFNDDTLFDSFDSSDEDIEEGILENDSYQIVSPRE